MLSKTTKLLMVIILIMVAIISIQEKTIKQVKSERDTYQNNTYGLLEDLEVLRKDSVIQAYQIQTLALDLDEYKKYRADDAKTISGLKLKLKHVTSISKQNMEVEVPVKAPIRDTIIIAEEVIKPIKTVSLNNPHIKFNGTIQNDSLTATVNVPVEITQIVHKVPKYKFLWWSWGCKAIKQVVVTDNPYVNLKYSELINIK